MKNILWILSLSLSVSQAALASAEPVLVSQSAYHAIVEAIRDLRCQEVAIRAAVMQMEETLEEHPIYLLHALHEQDPGQFQITFDADPLADRWLPAVIVVDTEIVGYAEREPDRRFDISQLDCSVTSIVRTR